MRRACPYREENRGPGKEVQENKLQRELDRRPGIREQPGSAVLVRLTRRRRTVYPRNIPETSQLTNERCPSEGASSIPTGSAPMLVRRPRPGVAVVLDSLLTFCSFANVRGNRCTQTILGDEELGRVTLDDCGQCAGSRRQRHELAVVRAHFSITINMRRSRLREVGNNRSPRNVHLARRDTRWRWPDQPEIVE